MDSLLVLLRLLAALALFRLLGLPIARLALPRLRATSYAVATAIGLAIAGHVTWLLGHAGMALGGLSVALGVAVLALLALASWRRLAASGVGLVGRRTDAYIHHTAFALALAFALAVTARNPSVDPDSERFMDYAMVNAVLASRSLPLESPWLAGERVSYYDYGYYSVAYLGLFTGDPAYLFPVAVALWYAALFASALAFGRDLVGFGGGLLAAWLVAVAGNLDAVIQTGRAGIGGAIDWFQSARVLAGGVITEFPFFALLWGDLHPYALALPLWPPLLAVAFSIAWPPVRPATVGVGAVLFAVLLATHTWDAVPVAALLVLVAVGAGLRSRSSASARPARELVAPLVAAVTIIALGAVLALPFLVAAPVGGRGVELVEHRSSFTELATAWGVPLLLLVVALLWRVAGSDRYTRWAPAVALAAGLVVTLFPEPGAAILWVLAAVALALSFREAGVSAFAWAAAAVGLGLVAGVEILFVDDVYSGELERMNTVFKAYIEAWVLLGVAAAVLYVETLRRAAGAGPLGRIAATTILVLAVVASAFYPVRGTSARAGDLLSPRGLDATRAFREQYPDDALAARRLGQLRRGVILETTGEPYSWNSRFASFTGFPAVVGWGHHEAGWRNGWELVGGRVADVETAYRTTAPVELEAVLERYAVDYVVVGELERARFPEASLAKFDGWTEAVRAGDTVVYHTPRSRLRAAGGETP